jgi:membrane-bound lytic murein transglycosylase D
MKKYLFVVWCFLAFPAAAQTVVVPNNVYLADLHLKINEKGRQEIQKKVDALHKYPSYFKIKVDRADTYFPIIERVFQEEGLPDDFKYLALQESGLIGDAVSTSNAVGYWQFKKEAASDQGLRMNNLVDERKHIIESSRGAARYLIRNNAYYRNWANTLLSYMEGFTGAKAYTKPSDIGAKSMEITEKTHYYVLTFLAHKIAYENFVGKNAAPLVSLQEVEAKPGQSLSEIALSTQIDPLELEKYNKWLMGSAVPGDKKYTVLIPVLNEEQEELLVSAQPDSKAKGPIAAAKDRKAVSRTKIIRVNDLKAVLAGKNETKEKMARRGNMSVAKFLRLNEMRSSDPIVEGETYFLEPKRNRAKVGQHVAQPGETMASVSRQYGVREKALLTKNRMHADEPLASGRVLWLQDTRPRSVPVEYRDQQEANTATGSGPIARNSPAPADTAKPAAPQEKAPAKRGRIDWRGEREAKASPGKAPATVPEAAPAAPQGGSSSDYVTADEDNPEYFPTEWSVSAAKGNTRARGASPRTPAAKPAAAPASRPGTRATSPPTTPAPAEPTAAPNQPAPVKAEPVATPTETDPTLETEEESVEDPVLAAPVEEPVPLKKAGTAAKKEAPAAPAPKAREVARPEATEAEETLAAPVRPEPARKEPVRVVKAKEKVEEAPAPAKPAAPAAREVGPSTSGTHKVAKSETLYGIARQYGVSVADLKEWNNLGEKPIAVGQELIVDAAARPATPAPAAKAGPAEKPAVGPDGKITHTVATGETIYQISRKYGVTIKEVMDWNKKSDFNVKVGEELKIKPNN